MLQVDDIDNISIRSESRSNQNKTEHNRTNQSEWIKPFRNL
jgi:hypothetical protein